VVPSAAWAALLPSALHAPMHTPMHPTHHQASNVLLRAGPGGVGVPQPAPAPAAADAAASTSSTHATAWSSEGQEAARLHAALRSPSTGLIAKVRRRLGGCQSARIPPSAARAL